jgi:hypothetical protein
LKPAYEELQKELGGPSSEGWDDHRKVLVEELRSEKALTTAKIAMTGGDVARQMAQSKAKIDAEV